jgi:hypothetical protein
VVFGKFHFKNGGFMLLTQKERNRRMFTDKRLIYIEVAPIARDDTLQMKRAFTAYVHVIPQEPD